MGNTANNRLQTQQPLTVVATEAHVKVFHGINEAINLQPYVIAQDDVRVAIPRFEISGIQDDRHTDTSAQIEIRLNLSPFQSKLSLRMSIAIVQDTGQLNVELLIHNPSAATHNDGLWDLGDTRSTCFREIGILVQHNGGKSIAIRTQDCGGTGTADDIETTAIESLQLKQINSGILQPDLAMSDGFHLEADHRTVLTGSRANALVSVELPSSTLLMNMPRFWQEYPSSINVTPTATKVAFFANLASEVHELQPGERKRRKLSIHIGDMNYDLRNFPSCQLENPSTQQSILQVNQFCLRAIELNGRLDKKLFDLVVHPAEFFAKRERINEYGWRDFGEVFADHESLYLDPSLSPYRSHYNNQYDLVLGFGLQYLRTGDNDWFELMDDLARHVVDIDIYHTIEDRVEYNHGLFWHTNHYQDAATATHRTFSKHNFDINDPVGSSGGPGPEHCYTTGLTLHYLMCGDIESKSAVLGLANWMRGYFTGENTLLGRVHSIAKNELPSLKKIISGNNEPHRKYPLTRATGNLIVAYLDAYELSNDQHWIDSIEEVLYNTFHPDDNVDAMNLDDVENTWSHTVFLQAVLRYLSVKESNNQLDQVYEYTRRAFLKYTHWMKGNAVPYLDTPERLEFVNDTWAAQDIRRCTLLFAAAAYDPANAQAYTKKADQLSLKTIERLGSSDTVHFSRIQAIIMQNLGISSVFNGTSTNRSFPYKDNVIQNKKEPSVLKISESAIVKLLSGMRAFDAKAEMRWLRQRR